MQGYKICFRPGCQADDTRNMFKMAKLSMEELRGNTRIAMNCRHRISPDGLTFELNVDNPYARDLAVIFIGTARRLLGEDCCRVTPICLG